ncbi:ribonuclease domain-containing protein [Nisaea sp.]|uniref:ribonuclease domain-containing protein n=1 Tax=Nisaea sp. TaxID=2024842 RepID=UPI00329A6B3D
MKRFVLMGAVALMTFSAVSAAEARIRACSSSLPKDVREAVRDLNYCMTNNVCAGLNATVYNNSPKRLPSIGHNQSYYEGRVGEDRSGGPGKRRLVYLVQGTAKSADAVVLERYFTANHYETFCEIQ